MYSNLIAALVAATFVAFATAECPNACSSHGRCGAYDMCTCYRNWMSNDCSERVCQFGLAHVDSPKGDLDSSSGKLSGPATTIIKNDAVYPYGTQEQYPKITGAGGAVLENTAHQYMECSNKGVCDRQTGTCACFDGYSGSGCQRASCPSSSTGVCSGHGTCETISTLSSWDSGNYYRLWDEDVTMGCKCDGGYGGADCSERICKFGADPLYFDDVANIVTTNVTFQIYTKSSSATVYGNYSIIFEDKTGEDWETGPIQIGATCDTITDILEAIPNDVIPDGSVRCYKHPTYAFGNVPIWDANMYIATKFTLVFPQNPGYLKQIRLNKYLDGTRATLFSDEATSTLNWHIYANGYIGEDTDYVPDLCEGVRVTLADSGSTVYTHSLASLTVAEAKLLKKCLGDSDGNSANNVEVYNWDHGDDSVTVNLYPDSVTTYSSAYPNPHLIKLIDLTQDISVLSSAIQEDPALWPFPKSQLCTFEASSVDANYGAGWCSARDPPGFYAVLYFDGTNFNIFNKIGADYDSTTEFAVYTTTGYLQRVSPIASAFSVHTADSASEMIDKYHSATLYLQSSVNPYSSPIWNIPYTQPTHYHGGVDCASSPNGRHAVADCLNKDDLVLFLNVDSTNDFLGNPTYLNIHRVKKLAREDSNTVGTTTETYRNRIELDYGVNTAFTQAAPAMIYKFHPGTNTGDSYTASLSQCLGKGTSLHTSGGFNYVSQCSGRGLCNQETGLCECFNGYTSDNCGVQNALAI